MEITKICPSAKTTRWRSWSAPFTELVKKRTCIGASAEKLELGSGYADHGVLNCSFKYPCSPTCCTCAIDAAVGPNEACSRKRAATAELTRLGPPATGRLYAGDTRLPGLVTNTVTLVPCCADVVAPLAVSCAAETNCVASATPPKVACAPLTNPLPLMVRLKAPGWTGFGEMEVIEGPPDGAVRVTLADADLLLSATLVAVTVTVFGLGSDAGA